MTHAIVRSIRQFLCDEDGPTAVEYAVMLMLILLMCITSIQLVGRAAGAMWSNSSSELNDAIKP